MPKMLDVYLQEKILKLTWLLSQVTYTLYKRTKVIRGWQRTTEQAYELWQLHYYKTMKEQA